MLHSLSLDISHTLNCSHRLWKPKKNQYVWSEDEADLGVSEEEHLKINESESFCVLKRVSVEDNFEFWNGWMYSEMFGLLNWTNGHAY